MFEMFMIKNINLITNLKYPIIWDKSGSLFTLLPEFFFLIAVVVGLVSFLLLKFSAEKKTLDFINENESFTSRWFTRSSFLYGYFILLMFLLGEVYSDIGKSLYNEVGFVTGLEIGQDLLISDLYTFSYYSLQMKIFILWTAISVFVISKNTLDKLVGHIIEFPIVFIFAIFFMLCLASSLNLFYAYVNLEGLAFALYILAAGNTNSVSSLEAAIKYFSLGAVSSGFILCGISIFFFGFNDLDLVQLGVSLNSIFESGFDKEFIGILMKLAILFVFAGFFFKLSIFPMHNWTPDVYGGVMSPITLFLATVVKISVFTFFVQFLYISLYYINLIEFWKPLLVFVSILSIAVGALGALSERKLKRFVGFTSINQMGFILLGLSFGTLEGLHASIMYLMVYVITSLAFFTIILNTRNSKTGTGLSYIWQLNGFGKKNRVAALFLALIIFSFAGIPPLSGFFVKFFLFLEIYQSLGLPIFLIIVMLNVISVFYYIRLIKCMFFEQDLPEINEVSSFRNANFEFYINSETWALFMIWLLLLIFLPFLFSDFRNYTWLVTTGFLHFMPGYFWPDTLYLVSNKFTGLYF